MAETDVDLKPVCRCMSCGLDYDDFLMDVNIPDDQWKLLTGRQDGAGIMCVWCLIERAVSTKKFTWAYMEFKE